MNRLAPRGRTFVQGLRRAVSPGCSSSSSPILNNTRPLLRVRHGPSAGPTMPPRFFFSRGACLLKHHKKNDARNKAGLKDAVSRELAGASSDAGAGAGAAAAAAGHKGPEPNPEDPLNFADVEFHWKKLAAHFRDAIAKLTTRGRFTPEALGRVPVKVQMQPSSSSSSSTSSTSGVGPGAGANSKPDRPPNNSSKSKQHLHHQAAALERPETTAEYYPLGELAQVAEGRGRLVSILVNEEQYVKPIMSAILNSKEYNQQPQRATGDGASSLELVMKVELTRPEDAMRQVKETAEHWRKRIREARAKRDKVHKEWKSSRLVLPDAVRKAETLLQKAQEKQLEEVGRVEDDTVKKLKATQL